MGKSSKDKRDTYYRLAKEQAWRARSAFKLIQLDEEFDLFTGCTRVVDLCAAPGSWSQVLSRVLVKGESFGRKAWLEKREREDKIIKGHGSDTEHLTEDAKTSGENSQEPLREEPTASTNSTKEPIRIVAIDLQPMSPLEGITILQGDITHPSTIPRILDALNPPTIVSSPGSPPLPQRDPEPVDLIVSDGAPDVTGLHDLDIHIQYTLLISALSLALRILRPQQGKFVAKIFRGKDNDMLLYTQLRVFFEKVTVAKPRASRASSLEAFIVCEGFLGVPEGFVLSDPGQRGGLSSGIILERKNDDNESEDDEATRREKRERTRWIPPFVACGDLSAWDDADATTHLPKDRISLDPVQPPTAPPYKRALELRRERGGLYGRTSKPQPKKAATVPSPPPSPSGSQTPTNTSPGESRGFEVEPGLEDSASESTDPS